MQAPSRIREAAFWGISGWYMARRTGGLLSGDLWS